jgi:abhydrolase domain-containing protein 6
VSMLFWMEGAGVVALLFVLAKRTTVLDRFKKTKAKTEQQVVAVGQSQVSYLQGRNRNGTCVLLLHGFPGDKEMWLDIIPFLDAAGYKVIAVDLPGFGANFQDETLKYDATTLTKTLKAFSRKVDVGVFHLVGHSVGAVIAASYAYGLPVEVASLTLIEPLGLSSAAESEFDKGMTKGKNSLLISAATAYDALVAFLTVKPPMMPGALKKRRAESWASGRAFYQRVWSELMQGDRAHLLDLLLPEMPVRTMALFGAKSKVVHPMTAKMLERRMEGKDSRVFTVEDSGHWPMIEKPKEVAEFLITFFRAPPRTRRERKEADGDGLEAAAGE